MDDEKGEFLKDNIMERIIETKENNDSFIIDKETWKNYNDQKNTYLTALNTVIDKRVEPEYKEEINNLFELVISSIDDCREYETHQYYITGFKDCMQLYTLLFSNEIGES